MDGHAAISTTVEKTHQIITEIEREMGWENRSQQALSALRFVLQALRDRMPVNEAVNFGAQLPELVRGIYYEGWSPSKVPIKRNRQQFLDEIQRNIYFETDVNELAQAVLLVVARHVSPGEMDKVRKSLPEDYGNLFP